MSLSRRDQSDCMANPGIAGRFPDRHRWSPRKQGVSGQMRLKPAWIKGFRPPF